MGLGAGGDGERGFGCGTALTVWTSVYVSPQVAPEKFEVDHVNVTVWVPTRSEDVVRVATAEVPPISKLLGGWADPSTLNDLAATPSAQ